VSWAIWITGPPASGKTVIAGAAAAELRRLGQDVAVLELDALRKILTPEPTYSDAERDVVYRTLVHVARLLTISGVPVLIDATAHRRAWRDLARASIPQFAEVQVTCPLPVRRERERQRQGTHAPKGIYAAAERPGATVPGVNVPYEPALAPELVVDTSATDVADAAAEVAALGVNLARVARTRPDGRDAGWAIWITGPPGSGKTTLSCSVAQRLQARGVPVVVLDLDELRAFVLDGRHPTPAEDDIVHRALACAALVLTDAGIAVVIDATAPRRAWREIGRHLITHFAEVELHCPLDVCIERERAVRWDLILCRPAPARRPLPGAPPDIAIDYQRSLHPDLTVETAVQSAETAAEQILRLAERVRRRALESRP
jgi:adenylylsulfate kinase